MSHWIAKFKPEDIPYEEDVLLRVEGTENGFVVMGSDGTEYTDWPCDTIEEAREEISSQFEGIYSSFQWLED